MRIHFLSILLILLAQTTIAQQATKTVAIKGGTYIPLYGTDTSIVSVGDFEIDIHPVTHQQYLDFVIDHPKWKKSKVTRLFANNSYLLDWTSDTTFSQAISNSPVNTVSWYAAKAYCEYVGKRLPTVDEWEYVAMADETKKDARVDSLYNQKILSSYETPKTYLKQVGETHKNIWGVYDLHGLVWEWTLDFNSVLISGESRKDVDTDRNLFCAGGAVGAKDLMNYAAFMRYAFRGSLKADFCIKNLGFRCVKDKK